LIGILIGDGNLWSDGEHFRIEVTGDPIRDKDFIEGRVKELFSKFSKNKIVVKERSHGLRIRTSSKEMFLSLINLGLHQRKEKIEKLEFLKDLDLNKRKLILRGLMDTDGSVIERSNKQVFMQLATNSKFLAEWSRDTLIAIGLRPFIAKSRNKSGSITFRVWLSGKENLRHWIKIIGLSNKFKLDKALNILSRDSTGTVPLRCCKLSPGEVY